MKKIILFIFISPFLWMACMEDKGTYEYVKINEMTVDTLKNQVVEIYDTLRMEAKVTCSQNTGELQYCWYRYVNKNLEIDTLSLEKNLEYKVTSGVGDYTYYLRVTDVNSGMSVKSLFRVSVVGKFDKGLMVLGEVNGISHFVFLNEADNVIELYGPQNGNELGHHPVVVANSSTTINGLKDMLILCQDERGGVTLAPSDLSVAKDFGQLFYVTPPITKPQAYYKGTDLMYQTTIADFIINNGKLYARMLGMFGDSQSAFNPAFPGSYELSPWAIVNGKEFLFFDNKEKSFLSVKGDFMNLNYAFFSLESGTTGFDPSNVGLELVYMAEGAVQGSSKRGFGIFRDTRGQLFCLAFSLSNFNGSMAAMKLLAKQQITADAVGIDAATGYAMSLAKPYLYYSKGSKIYQYELESNHCFPVYDTDTIPGLRNSTIDKIYIEYTQTLSGYGNTNFDKNNILYVSSSQSDVPERNGTLHVLELTENGTIGSRIALYKHVCGKTVSMVKK